MTDANFTCQRVLRRQRLTIEEFGPTIKYIEGEKNIAADTLSRIEINENKTDESKKHINNAENLGNETYAIYDQYAIHQDNVPVAYGTIYNIQKDDEELKKLKDEKSVRNLFGTKTFGKYKLWMKNSTKGNKWRIFVPKKTRVELMDWYHEALLHPGQSRMEESVLKYFTWPGCRIDIAKFVKTCKVCQIYKNYNNGKDGKIPLRDNIKIKPWEVLSVDLIGPWKAIVEFMTTKTKKEIEIQALTMMDDATGWIEIIYITNKRSREIAY